MSGFLFGGPLGPYFELFSENYFVVLCNEKTTTYIILFTTFNFGAKQSELITFYYFK